MKKWTVWFADGTSLREDDHAAPCPIDHSCFDDKDHAVACITRPVARVAVDGVIVADIPVDALLVLKREHTINLRTGRHTTALIAGWERGAEQCLRSFSEGAA